MSTYDTSKNVKGGNEDGEFDYAVDTVDLHDEEGSTFSDLFSNGFYGDGDTKGVFEYEYSASDYKQMLEEDGKAASLEAALTSPLASADWKLVEPDDDQGQTAFVDQFLRTPSYAGGMTTNFQTIIGQATSARTYRKAFFEKAYKPGTGIFAGQVVYRDVAFRPVDTCKIWVTEENGRYLGFQQRVIRKTSDGIWSLGGNEERINFSPPFCWVHVNGKHRDHIGGWSDMQTALWCYKTKKKVLYMWAIFLSTQGEPRTIVTGSTAADSAKKLKSMRGGGVVGLPNTSHEDVNVLESSGTGAQAFKDFMAYLDSQMLASRLAGFLDLTSPTQSTGSYALSADQSSFFKKAEDRFRREMEESITAGIIADLVLLNFGHDASVPEFQFEALESNGLTEAIALITPLMSTPDTPWAFKAALYEKVASIMDMPEDEIRTALEEAGKQAEERAQMAMDQQQQVTEQGGLANMVGQVDAAGKMVAAKQGGKPPGAGEKPGAMPVKPKPPM